MQFVKKTSHLTILNDRLLKFEKNHPYLKLLASFPIQIHMKIQITFIVIAILIFNSSFQCNKCVDIPDALIDNSRQWLPFKGKTQLTFINSNGLTKVFKLIVVDTIETEMSCTNKPYKYESIRGRLVLDSLDKDFIAFAIHPPNNLCIQCMTDRSNEVNGCNILTKPVFNGTAINLTNFRLRSSIYQEVILLKSSLANPIMDSVVVAKNFGIVGFKYNGESYMIQ